MENNRKKIDSIQGLRGFAFLAIFATHLSVINSWGGWGVSIFIVMSGFLMSLSYYNRIDSMVVSLKENIKLSVKKMNKLYPLHIIMLIVALVFWILKIVTKTGIYNIKTESIALVAQIFLVHGWIPVRDIYYSFNQLSWYLSDTMLFYILFPWIIRFIKKKNIKQLVLLSIIVYTVMWIWVIVITVSINDKNYSDFLLYTSPYFRLGDFAIGAIFGVVFIKSKKTFGTISSSVFEMIILLSVFLTVWYLNTNHTTQISRIIAHSAVACLPTSVGLVYLFAVNKGVISKIFSNKAIVYVGNMSPYGYLIHQMVIVLITTFGNYIFHTAINKWILAPISIVITWIAIYVYLFIEKLLFKKRAFKSNIEKAIKE